MHHATSTCYSARCLLIWHYRDQPVAVIIRGKGASTPVVQRQVVRVIKFHNGAAVKCLADLYLKRC
jgi:hypothetical protein